MENTVKNQVVDNGEKENQRAKIKLTVQRVLVYTFLIFLTILCLFFFYLLFVNATRSHQELQQGFTLLPSTHFFENLNKLWTYTALADIKRGILNSFIIASLSAIVTTYFSALCAFGIYAYDFKFKRIAETFILAIIDHISLQR